MKRALIAIALLALLAPATAGAALPDGRGWELVSPVEKNGGTIDGHGSVAAGGVLQASADGDSVTYSSAASFGPGAQSAPAGSQYISTRDEEGWSTENLTVPIFSGTFGVGPNGVPYQLFSADLERGLLLNGFHCRAQEGSCPVANPPLAGTDAPAGYQNYYLRDAGQFAALLGADDVDGLGIGPADFDLAFAGSSTDLRTIALSTCAALTPGAVEVPLGEGCDPAKPNLYLWSAESGLSLVNTVPGAALGAQAGAISDDGSRVYWADLAGAKLFLGQGAGAKQVDAAAGGGGTFQAATPDGGIAFFTKGGHLWRYDATADSAVDLTPGGGVLGMLGASDDGSRAYYATAAGVFLWNDGATSDVVEMPDAADPGNYPPSTGSARVSDDGDTLIFVSFASLTGYNNKDSKTEVLRSEVFRYAAAADELRCVSCRVNPLQRPIGDATIPGAAANGEQAGATAAYKPRALSADGNHVFFDSGDALVPADTNREPDVYQWEEQGVGDCAKAAGCIALISSGRAAGGGQFVDASADAGDVFFVTDGSLVGSDPGAFDLYDARVGGGFEEELEEIPCFGDACQSLPSEPTDPALSTLVPGPGNPRIIYFKQRKKEAKRCKAKAKGKKARGKCGKKKGGKKKGSKKKGSKKGSKK